MHTRHVVLAASIVSTTLCLSACPPEESSDVLDTAAFERGGAGSVEVLQALAVSDALFAFDPTLDPSLGAEANAMAIAAHARSIGACASAEVSGSTVTVTFASGCVLRTGVSASGAVSVEVASAGGALDVVVSFDALAIGARALDGTAAFHTSNGSTLGVELALTTSSGAVGTDLTVTGSSGQMELDGTVSLERDGTTTTLALADVIWRASDCYPSAGTMTVSTGRISQTVTFSSATPSTGTVSVTQGRTTRDATLPAYGACPMGA